ncbi:MAG TPA: hypothetical protein ENN34_04585 [Deltaproteobacteria bacterium]|nr:hypothetical protein [Deltaproteobacteria bacterium]
MLDFTTWFIVIAVICVASLLIDARRSHKVVDNLPEYRKMFDQGDSPSSRAQEAPVTDPYHYDPPGVIEFSNSFCP